MTPGEKRDPFEPTGEIRGGYDMGMAQAYALEHAKKTQGEYVGEGQQRIPLIWSIESSSYDEDLECFKVVLSCQPESVQPEQKGMWEYHVRSTGGLMPGTPLLRQSLRYTLPRSQRPLPWGRTLLFAGVAGIILGGGVVAAMTLAPGFGENLRSLVFSATPTPTRTPTPRPTPTPTPRPTPTPTPTPTPSNITFLGNIPSLNARATALRFFEGGGDVTPQGQRVFRERFAAAASRYIMYELGLERPDPGRRIDFTIIAIYYRPDGSVGTQFTHETYVEATWTASVHSSGWGWATPGSWSVGRYPVELYVAGEKVASGWFQVY